MRESIKISNKTCQQHYQFIWQSFPQTLLFVLECQVFPLLFLREIRLSMRVKVYVHLSSAFMQITIRNLLKSTRNPRQYRLTDFYRRECKRGFRSIFTGKLSSHHFQCLLPLRLLLGINI
jgi:hypothetical protein